MDGSFTPDKVPLAALRNATRGVVSSLLNPCKVLPSPSKYPRDFRGLAYVANVPLPPCNCHDQTEAVLNSWEKKGNPTVADFISALELIDRWDVIEDINELIEKDVQEFSKGAWALEKPRDSPALESDKEILTVDDVLRIEKGLEPQIYDAFILYSDDDIEFATQMIDRLEQQYQLKITEEEEGQVLTCNQVYIEMLHRFRCDDDVIYPKLCIKDRDLVGGVTFEHEAIMRLISERCKRLVIIISPSFIESPANKFFVTYAQALGIEQRQRKIIPCTYKSVRLPPELMYYFVLHYNRSSPLWNFWDQLNASVKAPIPSGSPTRNAVRITELPASKWDSPEKNPKALPALPAAVDASAPPDEPEKVTPPRETCYSTPVSPVAADGPEPNRKSKSKSFSLSTLLPSPPNSRLKKTKWWKNKKKLSLPPSL